MTTIKLPARLFDPIAAIAEKFGGIGAGATREGNEPLCFIGLASDAGLLFETLPFRQQISGFVEKQDRAIAVINARKGNKNTRARVPMSEWCEELGVVRAP